MFRPRPNTLFAGGMFIALLAMAIILPAAARNKAETTATPPTFELSASAQNDTRAGSDAVVEAGRSVLLAATATATSILPTAIPTGTPTAIPVSRRNASATPDIYNTTQCYVAPIPWDEAWGTQDQNVYMGPGAFYGVIGTLNIWEYVPATGYYTQENYGRWTRVDYYGAQGWVNTSTYAFSPACTDDDPDEDIPYVAYDAPPPTWTPTLSYTRPSPTSIQSEGRISYFSYTLSGESGAEHLIENILADASEHVLTITLTGLSPETPHTISLGPWCVYSDYLRFSFYGENPIWTCADILRVDTSTETHEIKLIMQGLEGIPGGGQSYLLWVRVDLNQ